MRPNDALVTVKTGLPRLGWFKTSNISERNWTLSLSVTLVFLVTEKSVLMKFGPVMESRPRSPGWQTPATQGETNKALLANHCVGLPVVWIGPVMSGRTVKEMPGPGPMDKLGLSGLPVCACCVTPSCQPETIRLDLNGSS